MIGDDRGSQIADRKESCFHIIANGRRADFCLHFSQRKCRNYRRFVLTGKLHRNNMACVEDEILLHANFFFLLVLTRRHRQLQNLTVENIGFAFAKCCWRDKSLGPSTLWSENFVFTTESTSSTTIRSSYVAEFDLRSAADKLNFSPIISQQLAFLFLSLKFLLLRW